jgi:hypothetical protein
MVKANHITSLSASQKNTANPAIQSAMEAVLEVRTEIAAICQQMADKNGEPPLDQQDWRCG